MAFDDSYDCHALGETSIGWDAKAQKYSAEASTSLKRSAIVKLSDLNTAVPLLTGQGVTPLRKVSEAPGAVWFIEERSGHNCWLDPVGETRAFLAPSRNARQHKDV